MKKWENYIDEVLSFVRFKYDHREIRRELTEHMEDLQEELMAEGMDEDVAAEMTVMCMGEAREIGEALNKEHSMFWGLLWYWSRAAAIIVFLVFLLYFSPFLTGIVRSSFETYEHPEDTTLVWEIPLDREYKVYDDTLILEDVYYYEDKTLTIVYRTKKNPFARSMDWSRSISEEVWDENGENLREGGGGFKQGGYNGIGWNEARNIPEDAKTLVIHFGNLRIYVDLETGEVTEDES